MKINTNRKIHDDELVEYLKRPEKTEAAIKFIYKEYFAALSKFVVNNSGSLQDAEDVFQEVVVSFIYVVQKNKFRAEASIKSFLYSINRHIWLNEIRKKNQRQNREHNYYKNYYTTEADIHQFIEERELRSELMNLVGQLSEECRQVLVQYYYNNLSIREIQEKMNYSSGQVVRNKKCNCMKELSGLISKNSLLANNHDILYN